ncbi:MAG: hypothetical protein ACLRJV_17720 [Eubacteriales bacterium]
MNFMPSFPSGSLAGRIQRQKAAGGERSTRQSGQHQDQADDHCDLRTYQIRKLVSDKGFVWKLFSSMIFRSLPLGFGQNNPSAFWQAAAAPPFSDFLGMERHHMGAEQGPPKKSSSPISSRIRAGCPSVPVLGCPMAFQ